jgi:monovalent cation:H+ antiporter-2, CPA2 family
MDSEILKDIVIIFALSTFVNFLFTKIRVPTLVGYLITGIVAGPFLLGIINGPHEIDIMAEIGVVILMFTIGMEFSLKHLLKIRRVVFLGGFIQLFMTALVTMVLARTYNMDWKGAIFIGFLTALSSTAVVLKILQDRSEVTSNYGRTVVGILIFQDIIIVPMMLFTPFLKGETANFGMDLFALIIKAAVIIGFVYAGNKWIIPKLLHRIAMTRNQELFLMSILLICSSVALFTSELGITLAFGAFLAGLMVSESEYSDNAFSNLIPFRDTFTSFFFVSIGMLLDLHFVFQNIGLILLTVLLVIGVKFIIAGFTAFLMGHTLRGTVLVGIALSQVGEFSFILAKMGVSYEILTDFYYQLFLAVAIITMSVSPLLIQMGNPLANLLFKLPLPRFLVNGLYPLQQIDIPELSNHLVLIGKDSRAINLSVMAKYNNIPYISIVFDPAIVRKRQEKGESIIYGNAVNESILQKAYVNTAKIVLISVGDLITAMAITDKVRHMNKHALILVRTKHIEDIEELYRLGASQVIPEEFETAIDLFERILSNYLVPQNEINSTIARIRDDQYGIFYEKKESEKYSVLKEIPNIEIVAYRVGERSILKGKTLAESELRKRYGITLVALKREDELFDHPNSTTLLQKGDIAYILGKPEQIANATILFNMNGA